MNQNWHYIFPKKSLLRAYNVQHFKALIVNNKNKLQQQNENSLICALINPLSPNGDQHQFSPNDIHTLSRDYVMRINKMIT